MRAVPEEVELAVEEKCEFLPFMQVQSVVSFARDIHGSNDFMGLVCVDQLPKTTRIHHIISTILVFTSLSLDFQESDIGQAMLVYTRIRWRYKKSMVDNLFVFAT